MEKFEKILKNVLIFLVVFLAISYLTKGCSQEATPLPEGAITLKVANEISRTSTVRVEIINKTAQPVVIKSECPGEPLNVYRYENNAWVQKTSTPVLDCSNIKDTAIEAGKSAYVTYNNWNHELFWDMGRFKAELATTIDGKETTIASNEFTVTKEGILKQLWYGVFYRPIYNGLILLTVILPKHDLGFAIILLTILIRTILLIPSQKAMKSQRKMQEIQPKLDKIKEQHKGDQQKIASETMALWKSAKVNPFGSCLPILLQFPFLIAVFYAVQGGINPDNTYLLYKTYEGFSLSNINVNFLGILDLTKINLYVLPLIIGGLQFAQMKLSFAGINKKKEEKGEKKNEMTMANNMMTYMMPVMIAVFTASVPSGVGLYWGASTTYGIVQQIFVNKSPKKKDPDEPTVRVIEPKK